MQPLVMALIGGGVGLGAVLLLSSLRSVTEPLAVVFAKVEQPGHGYTEATPAEPVVRQLLSRLGGAIVRQTGDEERLRSDLAVTGSSIEQHALVKAGWPAGTALVVYLLWLAATFVGAAPGPVTATFVAIGAAAASFIVPDVRLRSRAALRRASFRHALSAYLDLVTVILAGGGGLLTALQSAADAGDGWAFAEIRGALDRARLSGRSPWSQLGELGARFEVPELVDLASTAHLAGSQGARMTESVATRADVLRARLQSEIEKSAESMTEQLLLPVGLLLVALFLFLGFAIFDQLGGTTELNFSASRLHPLRSVMGLA